jgi:SAM-dependent methyltransferase
LNLTSPRRIAGALWRYLGGMRAAQPVAQTVEPPTDARGLLQTLSLVVERFPRDYDSNYVALRDYLRACAEDGEAGLARFGVRWIQFVEMLFAAPVALQLLFPDVCSADPGLVDRARKAINTAFLPDALEDGHAKRTSAVNASSGEQLALLARLLGELESADPGAGPPFRFLSRYLFLRDMLVTHFVRPELRPVQEALFTQCALQRQNWRHSYADDYPYQGLVRLAVGGAKPGEERLARYDIARFLDPAARVLDIGANNGFLSLAIAPQVRHIDAIEFNPYLCEMARIAARHLQIGNVDVSVGDFVEFRPSHRYDAVLSLANHCTIDGNLSMDFEAYVAKCYSALKPAGYLFFESHNVFGPGKGGPGDDGDLDLKFDIVERYFEVVRHRMTECYVPAFDVDKLFVVLRRREAYRPDAQRTFRLESARQRYAY